MEELRERFRPRDEPFRGEWDALHAIHVALLQADNRVTLREACLVADEKYMVFVRWRDWRMARFAERS